MSILLGVVVYNKTTRWVAALIVPFLCYAGYLGWQAAEDLKGSPTRKVYKDDAMYLGSSLNPPKFIYVMIQPLNTDEPILMGLPFTESLAQKMAQANKNMCEGRQTGTRGSGNPVGEEEGNETNNFGQRGEPTIEIYDFSIKVQPFK